MQRKNNRIPLSLFEIIIPYNTQTNIDGEGEAGRPGVRDSEFLLINWSAQKNMYLKVCSKRPALNLMLAFRVKPQ